MTTCGEVLVELLEAYGIDTVFGIPGVHTIELYRGLANSEIRHVTPRHEQGAGFMADGYYRASGKLAACFIITGPGLTNIATAMGQAYGDSVPMLVISSTNHTHEIGLGEGRLHELNDQSGMFEHVTAFSHVLLRPDELPDILARAFAVFRSARPRPVLIQVPLDVMVMDAGHVRKQTVLPIARPAPDTEAIASAAEILHAARRPMIILGGGTIDAAGQTVRLVETLGAPTLLTTNAKGVLPPGHPLNLGSTLAIPSILEALRDADAVLAVGTELGETETLLFKGQRLHLNGNLIRVDIDADQLTRPVLPSIGILSDAGLAMSALAEALSGRGPRPADRAYMDELLAKTNGLMSKREQRHQVLFEAILTHLPDAIVVGDSTQPIYTANTFQKMSRPRSYFNSTTGFGTLGYALPAAVGAKLSSPDRPVVAVAGDGGFQYTINEMASAQENDLSLIVVLWNNQSYQHIREHMSARNLPQIGVNLFAPDFQAIADGYGWHAAKVSSVEDLNAALLAANKRKSSSLIEIDETATKNW